MVNENTGSRRWDRAPETAADKRFFDLRESGYTGWIDQDGYAVADVDSWIEQQRDRRSDEHADSDEM